MAKSKNINLNLTPEDKIQETLFDDWRKSIDGYNGENAVNPSNFEIVDKEIGDIKEALKHISNLHFEIVEELPDVGEPNIIYLILSEESKEKNFYDEYIYLEDSEKFELIGSTQITFDNIPTKDSPNAITSGGVYTALQDKVDKEQGKGLSSNDYTNNEKSKLEGIETGAQVNVQADWEEEDPTSDAYIANKPTVPAAQVNSDWNAQSGVAQILNKPDLSVYAENNDLAYVAFSGSYNDLLDTPDIPQSQIQSDWNQTDDSEVDYIKNKPDIEDMIAEEQSRAIAVETELETKIETVEDNLQDLDSNLSNVAFSGSYKDLVDKPDQKIENLTELVNILLDDLNLDSATEQDYPLDVIKLKTYQKILELATKTQVNSDIIDLIAKDLGLSDLADENYPTTDNRVATKQDLITLKRLVNIILDDLGLTDLVSELYPNENEYITTKDKLNLTVKITYNETTGLYDQNYTNAQILEAFNNNKIIYVTSGSDSNILCHAVYSSTTNKYYFNFMYDAFSGGGLAWDFENQTFTLIILD